MRRPMLFFNTHCCTPNHTPHALRPGRGHGPQGRGMSTRPALWVGGRPRPSRGGAPRGLGCKDRRGRPRQVQPTARRAARPLANALLEGERWRRVKVVRAARRERGALHTPRKKRRWRLNARWPSRRLLDARGTSARTHTQTDGRDTTTRL